MTQPPPYDPDLRRDTPLALKLKERIRRDGPITVAQYMEACLQDPEHGYYVRQQAIGARGDFVTAPEISQVFGELIGLWCAVVWQQMGSPSKVNLVELGPGRGTLMRDALRAAKVLPDFLAAVHVHLVETNSTLRQLQATTLAEAPVRISWRDRLAEPALEPSAPTIVIANEFLDTSPVEQSVLVSGRWLRRGVDLDAGGRLVYTILESSSRPAALALSGTANDGDFVEQLLDNLSLPSELLGCSAPPLAALFLDYGHAEPLLGDTLQAVRQHRAEHPLASPGEADLTAHVDFSAFAGACRDIGLLIDGPVTQSEFLGQLGILQRAARLMSANPAKAHEIESGVARLLAVPGMGDRFKVIGIRSPSLPPLPGFPVTRGA